MLDIKVYEWKSNMRNKSITVDNKIIKLTSLNNVTGISKKDILKAILQLYGFSDISITGGNDATGITFIYQSKSDYGFSIALKGTKVTASANCKSGTVYFKAGNGITPYKTEYIIDGKFSLNNSGTTSTYDWGYVVEAMNEDSTFLWENGTVDLSDLNCSYQSAMDDAEYLGENLEYVKMWTSKLKINTTPIQFIASSINKNNTLDDGNFLDKDFKWNGVSVQNAKYFHSNGRGLLCIDNNFNQVGKTTQKTITITDTSVTIGSSTYPLTKNAKVLYFERHPVEPTRTSTISVKAADGIYSSNAYDVLVTYDFSIEDGSYAVFDADFTNSLYGCVLSNGTYSIGDDGISNLSLSSLKPTDSFSGYSISEYFDFKTDSIALPSITTDKRNSHEDSDTEWYLLQFYTTRTTATINLIQGISAKINYKNIPIIKNQTFPETVATIGKKYFSTQAYAEAKFSSGEGAASLQCVCGFESLLKGFIKGHLDLKGSGNETTVSRDINLKGKYYTSYIDHKSTGDTSLPAESYSLIKYYDANSIESFYTNGTGDNYEISSVACCTYILYE